MMDDKEFYLFDLQGYLTVEDALTAEQVAALNEQIDAYLAREVEADTNTKRFSPKQFGAAYFPLIDNPRIDPYMRTICGDGYRLDHDYIDIIRSGLGPIGAMLHGGGAPYDPSQYYVYHDGRMYNGLTVVAYNLKDVNPGDGGFGCVPGSHKANRPYPEEWKNLEEAHPWKRAVPGKAGTAIIFTEALTHGTMPWRGADERRTLFLKYCPGHMAWSRKHYTGEEREDLTDAQRRIMRVPGVYPK
jgi:ectoine hydroxylase-related dioxygenase (phytanoyl-CoA dioxygenase family)